jgi:hypothetical protein
MADRIGVTNAMFIVVLVSGLVQLLVWNFVYTYAGIVREIRETPNTCLIICTDGSISAIRFRGRVFLVPGYSTR